MVSQLFTVVVKMVSNLSLYGKIPTEYTISPSIKILLPVTSVSVLLIVAIFFQFVRNSSIYYMRHHIILLSSFIDVNMKKNLIAYMI
jgi:hypothetical protein